MSPKRVPKIPTSVRLRRAAGREFRDAWSGLRELRTEHAATSGKPSTAGALAGGSRDGGGAAVRANPWQRCTSCWRRRSPEDFECDVEEHEGICNRCCGCPRARRGGGGAAGCSCSGGCDCAQRDDELEDDEDYGLDDEQGSDQGESAEGGDEK